MRFRRLSRGMTVMAAAVLLSAAAPTAGQAQGDFGAGKAAYDRQDYRAARKQWLPLAKKGDPRTMYWMGELYFHGRGGFKKNYKKAAEWYRKASDKGLAIATARLAGMHFNGYGVDQDDTKAVALYREAAAKGHVKATIAIGLFYMDGFVLPKDERQARRWFRKAVRQGSPDAMILLSDSLSYSEKIPRDYKRAYTWLIIAEKRGHPKATIKKKELFKRVYDGEIFTARKWAKAYLKNGKMPPKLAYEE